jgi:Adaptor complexes medium subunit family
VCQRICPSAGLSPVGSESVVIACLSVLATRPTCPGTSSRALHGRCMNLLVCLPPQVFLDVVESVNLLVNSNGTVVRSEVVGALKMRTYLSGMPECKLGLNDKVTGADQQPGRACHVCAAHLLASSLIR